MKSIVNEFEKREHINRHRAYVLLALGAFCALAYYFGELIDLLGWKALRWDFFYGVHDTQRLLFLGPIIYAAYVFGVKAVMIVTAIAAGTMIPRALLISPYPDPVLRPLLFCFVAGGIGGLVARLRTQAQDYNRVEARFKQEKGRLTEFLAELDEGVMITGPDYRIRFLNPTMAREFGEGTGLRCFEYFHKSDVPCYPNCELLGVLNGKTEKTLYKSRDGVAYNVVALPCADAEGVLCQLAIFRPVTGRAAPQPAPALSF